LKTSTSDLGLVPNNGMQATAGAESQWQSEAPHGARRA
jgi:hypothetical protein